ncbi:MAG: response regulator [Zoogloeaceae bacterium]|nr:response regulator [Rhodocyclaceae bacterium]MCP5235655.1 response regulator [Zoogloeaceae bacterium]
MTQTILLVEDDDTLRGTVAKFLTRQGFEVVTASDGGSALEQLRSRRFAVTLLDLHLPDITGLVHRRGDGRGRRRRHRTAVRGDDRLPRSPHRGRQPQGRRLRLHQQAVRSRGSPRVDPSSRRNPPVATRGGVATRPVEIGRRRPASRRHCSLPGHAGDHLQGRRRRQDSGVDPR